MLLQTARLPLNVQSPILMRSSWVKAVVKQIKKIYMTIFALGHFVIPTVIRPVTEVSFPSIVIAVSTAQV